MSDPSARITLIDSPIASPGCCAICGKNEHPVGFAATDNFDFEFYGTVYFCADCAGDYARLFGFMSPSEVSQLKNQVKALINRVEALKHENSVLESALDGFTGLSNLRSRRDVYDDSHADDSVGEPSSSSEESEGVTESRESHQLSIDELSAEQGPDDVRDSASASAGIDELLAL